MAVSRALTASPLPKLDHITRQNHEHFEKYELIVLTRTPSPLPTTGGSHKSHLSHMLAMKIFTRFSSGHCGTGDVSIICKSGTYTLQSLSSSIATLDDPNHHSGWTTNQDWQQSGHGDARNPRRVGGIWRRTKHRRCVRIRFEPRTIYDKVACPSKDSRSVARGQPAREIESTPHQHGRG